MYRYLARQFATALGDDRAVDVFLVHPLQLSRWLETAWAASPNVPVIGSSPLPQQLGSPTVAADFDMPAALLSTLEPGIDPADPGSYLPPGRLTQPLLWDHLAYAYVIESTGVYEILAQILTRIVRGETLGRLSPATLQWARATEELLFRHPPLYSIGGIESRVRSDIRISRRNAYWRMFGLDLPHPLPAASADGGAPWKADVGNGVNTAFFARWTELLQQVWTGFENRANQVGTNATDPEYVALLCTALDDMLGNRRRGGLLAREEFSHVAAMSWCHLTVEYNSPLVIDLQATATSPAERLANLGDRVGMAPAPRSRELFQLSEPMSALVWAIELSLFNTGDQAQALYLPTVLNGPPTPLNIAVNRLVDLWQSATGTRVKQAPAGTVGALSATRPSAQPLRVPAPAPDRAPEVAAMVPAANGHRS
jgi:hypothetical protein